MRPVFSVPSSVVGLRSPAQRLYFIDISDFLSKTHRVCVSYATRKGIIATPQDWRCSCPVSSVTSNASSRRVNSPWCFVIKIDDYVILDSLTRGIGANPMLTVGAALFENPIFFNNKTQFFCHAQAKTPVVSVPFSLLLCFIRNVQTPTPQWVTVVRPLCLRPLSFQRALLIDTIYNMNVIASLRAHFTEI